MANDSANAAIESPPTDILSPAPPAPTASPKGSSLRRFWTWLTVGDDLARLRHEQARLGPERLSMLRLARDYTMVADGLLDASDDVPAAPVLALYREALFLLLADTMAGKKTLSMHFETAPESVLEQASQAHADLASIGHLLAMHALVGTSHRPTPEHRDLAQMTRSAVHRLLDVTAPTRIVRQVQRRRGRLGLAAVVLLLGLAGLAAGAVRLVTPTDLAAGKSWRTSSTLAAGYTAKILFHTNEEMNPWFEIDLGTRETVKALMVKNRADSNQDRAIPLIAEVSDDQSTWHEVARRDASFSIWELKFPPRKTRFVRLRVPRVTALHLEEVKVF